MITNNKSKVTDIFKDLCKKHGMFFVVSEQDKGYFIDHNNIKHHFDYGTIDLNEYKYIQLANDKNKSALLMNDIGIQTPKEIIIRNSKRYTNNDLYKKIIDFLNLKSSVIIKPLNGKQGDGLLKLDSEKDLINFISGVKTDDDLLVQEYLNYPEIRIVMLDGEVIQSYRRLRPYIIGDGMTSICNLIKNKNIYFKRNIRNTVIDPHDNQINIILSRLGYTLNSILEKNKQIPLSFGRNLSKGGEYEFIDDKINNKFNKILKEMFTATNLRLVGFDLFIKTEIEKINIKEDIVFIEYNGSPDMENNFYYNNDYGRKFSEIYSKIFDAIIKSQSVAS